MMSERDMFEEVYRKIQRLYDEIEQLKNEMGWVDRRLDRLEDLAANTTTNDNS